MADRFSQLEKAHIDFIREQHVFFVGTAVDEGSVNVSPKGMDSFRVIDERTVVWLNLTGSGNETAAHVRQNPRMTLMFCSFDKQPLILRLYGNARVIHPRDDEWPGWEQQFPIHEGARQFFVVDLHLVQTSCGFAVPYYEYQGERPTLSKWAVNRGRDEIEAYWLKKNTKSLDGFETGIDD